MLPSIPASAPFPPFPAGNTTRWISPTAVSGILPVLSGTAASATGSISLPSGIPSTLLTKASSTGSPPFSSIAVTSSSSVTPSSSSSPSARSSSPPSSSSKSSSSSTTQAPRPPPTRTPPNCTGINNPNFITQDLMRQGIQNFCIFVTANNKHDENSGSFLYTQESVTGSKSDEAIYAVDWPQGVSIADKKDECIASLNLVMDSCDGVPANPFNFKHGGNITYGDFTYHVTPTYNQGYVPGRCNLEFTTAKRKNSNDWTLSDLTVKDGAQIPRVGPGARFDLPTSNPTHEVVSFYGAPVNLLIGGADELEWAFEDNADPIGHNLGVSRQIFYTAERNPPDNEAN